MNKAIIITMLATVILFSMAGCAETKALPTAEAAVIQKAEAKESINCAGSQESLPVSFSESQAPSVGSEESTIQGAEVTPEDVAEAVTQEEVQEEPPETLSPANMAEETVTIPVEQSPELAETVPQQSEEEPEPEPEAPAQPAESPSYEEPTDEPAEEQIQEPVKAPEPAFDINYWMSFAQGYAQQIGLNVVADATDCWDNPIVAGPHCKYLERDITDRLSRYSRDEEITDVWIWAESRSDGSYDLFIGYA